MLNTIFHILEFAYAIIFLAMLSLGFVRARRISGKIPLTREGLQELADKDKSRWSIWNEAGSKRWRYTLFGLAVLLVILNFMR